MSMPLRRIVDRQKQSLADSTQCAFKTRGFGCTIWIEHPAHDGFPDAQASRQFAVGNPLLLQRAIECELRRDPQRNCDQPLLPFRRRSWFSIMTLPTRSSSPHRQKISIPFSFLIMAAKRLPLVDMLHEYRNIVVVRCYSESE